MKCCDMNRKSGSDKTKVSEILFVLFLAGCFYYTLLSAGLETSLSHMQKVIIKCTKIETSIKGC